MRIISHHILSTRTNTDIRTPTNRRIKALLFTLIRSFHFGLTIPLEEIKPKSKLVMKPYLASDVKNEKGTTLPLLVTPLEVGAREEEGEECE